jgi:hypothetical protein
MRDYRKPKQLLPPRRRIIRMHKPKRRREEGKIKRKRDLVILESLAMCVMPPSPHETNCSSILKKPGTLFESRESI